MLRTQSLLIVIASVLMVCGAAVSQTGEGKLILNKARQFEVVLQDNRYVTYVVGDVEFQTATGYIYCDSARWLRGENVRLNGEVLIDDAEYRLTADSAFYNLQGEVMRAYGKKVELWSYDDSVLAVGTNAYYEEKTGFFLMENRPTLYLNYPDSLSMVEVIADRIEYYAKTDDAQAYGSVNLLSQDIQATSNCAIMNTAKNVLDLFEGPSLIRGESVVSGRLISIYYRDDRLDYVDVIDSARGEFKEPIDTTKIEFDESILTGQRIIMDFQYGLLHEVTSYGQAYSWYYPSPRGKPEKQENSVSGDTIRFDVEDDQLRRVHVVGGAIGRYLSGKIVQKDTLVSMEQDTIDYSSHRIEYALQDSLIMLYQAADVKSGSVALSAHEITFNTSKKLIEAFSAELSDEPKSGSYSLAEEVQPNFIPVVLKDKTEEIYGDYLLYSIETEKGRIIQSKSNYTTGYYYGRKLFREQKDIFYVDDGRYTTCENEEPHFHFYSSHMKLIEGEKLIAKPVVFYVERIPILALPYYVFPLKKGRHSGILPFTFGQFQRGERYLRNVGYYWAASDYMDWQGAFDYYELSRTLNFNSRLSFNKRYVLNGYVSGNYSRVTGYNRSFASESKSNRWTIRGAYDHIFSPSFDVKSYGEYQSDNTYYTDFSQNLDERLNRNTISKLTFRKLFGRNVSLSGQVVHDVNLDQGTRNNTLPSLALSVPTIYPFGSGGISSQNFLNKFSLRYGPTLLNHSSRRTLELIDTVGVDTTIILDTLGQPIDTTYTTLTDTSSYRSRKKYTIVRHNPTINLPSLKLGNYLNVIPSFSYNEAWVKVYQTDQSDTAGIDASKVYRTYSWAANASANTKLYGTIYPNIGGLVGLRHVLAPSVSYRYTPDIDRHPEVRAYAGGVGSARSSALNFSLEHLFLAKVMQKETEKSLQLLRVSSSFSYDFEQETRPYSDLFTNFETSQVPFISTLSGSMRHSFYDPGTDNLNFWSPYLQSFDIHAAFSIRGENFFFDDPATIPRGVDSASALQAPVSKTTAGQGWNLSATYNYSENGRGSDWSNTSSVTLNLSFNLTPSTTVNYTQYYDISRRLTINNSINITRKIHCWTGFIYWVPKGSNSGFGFRLYATALPELKIDNNYDGFTRALQR